MVFPVVVYGYESRTIKKSERWRIDGFKMCGWRRLEILLDCKEGKPVNPFGNQSWILIGRTDAEAQPPNTLATWCEELTPWKRPWCWARLKVGGEGDDRGWGGWMVSLTWWTWFWESSGSWWWTRKPALLQFMGLQRVRYNWTELNQLCKLGILLGLCAS